MSHNLLPKTERTLLQREYYIRLLTICFFLGSIALVIGIASLAPAYFYSAGVEIDVKEERATCVLQTQTATSTIADPDACTPEEGAHMLALAKLRSAEDRITDMVTEALTRKPESVSVSGISYDRTGNTMSLEGVAESRENIVAYVQALEESPRFMRVPNPTATLAKSTDIPFRLSFSTATSTL